MVVVATTLVFGLQLVNSKNNHRNDQPLLISSNTKHKPQNLSNEYLNLIEADENGLYLVGLFDIHQSNPRTPFKCGKIDVDSGESQSKRPMQNMEAFLWAIEQVNLDKNLLPGIKLGSLVMDTCSSFLRTNQQMANLLHGQLASKFGQQVPNLRQIMAIIADNSDYPSIEAVASMASALGITTFVTQSRSSKLSELARKYTMSSTSGHLHNQNQAVLSNADSAATSANLANQDSAILRMLSLQAPPQQHQQPPIEDSLNLDYSQESVQKRSLGESPLSSFQSTHNSVMSAAEQKRFEGMLSELLGIGKMTTPATSSNIDVGDNMMPMTSGLSEAFLTLNSSATTNGDTSSYNIEDIERQHKLLMVKMLLGNELLADALASLISAMQWDFVSIIYDDELDMIDLHDELVRILYNRNIQLALDEQIAFGSAGDIYDKLLQNLAKKSTHGARVVVTLLGTGSSRSLLDSLHHFRSSQLNSRVEQINQVNSLIWITVSDREPYYSFATDALGTLTVSSAVSLIPEFKAYYDRLVSEEHVSINRWWPEYMKAILMKHQKDIELISNECSKWLEPRSSPLQERCRSLTLSSLVQYEKSAANHLLMLNNTKSGIYSNNNNNTKPAVGYNSSKLSKYLANGWDHNGMDVINSVLAAANGLESIRQALCPDQAIGICARMHELVQPTATIQQQFSNININNDNNKPQVSSNNESANINKSNFQMDNLPMLSELIYNEMSRSTFQLADGRMFNLEDDFNSNSLGQVEGKLKLYNLRYLQANSIGFVKFGSFDRQDGLLMNSSKALHYTNSNNYLSQVPIENVRSTCQDESKCLMLSSYESSALNKQQQENHAGSGYSATTTNRGISEEELASGVNNLFKLDHPQFVLSPQSSNNHHGGDSSSINQSAQTGNSNGQQQVLDEQDSHVQTIRAFPSFLSGPNFSWNSSSFVGSKEQQQQQQQQHFNNIKTFNVIVLLPLHRRNQSSSLVESSKMPSLKCSEQMDIEHSFQHLVALSYAQKQLANSQQEWLTNSNNNDRNGQLVEPQIELTTTVIDYCEQSEIASSKLAAKLKEGALNGRGNKFVGDSIAVIDFDSQISKNIAKLVAQSGLLHLSIGSENQSSKETLQKSGESNEESTTSTTTSQDTSTTNTHLRVSLLPSKTNEIQALVKLISAMNQWKLVHLIYTDHHHYRDEFVRRANEANICVSKLIWIPALDGTKTGNRNNVLGGEKEQMVDEVEQKTLHLEKMKQLFSRELHDYSSSNSFSPQSKSQPPTKIFPSSGQNPFKGAESDDESGLNNTRVLVVLASENDSTNQMILEAASKSMLDDYIWVTSHEWLNSVELPSELHQHQQQQQKATLIESSPTKNSIKEQKLPKYFVSTKLETFESNDFKSYFANLSPSIHSPVPTNWFDQFWQQNFQCKLPISNSVAAAATSVAGAPVCKSNERLDLHNIIEDDKVHYTILALESLHAALEAAQNLTIDTKSKEFASIFKLTFDRSRNQPPSSKLFVDDNNNNDNNLLNNKLFAKLPYGFHIVHRLLPPTTPPIVEDRIGQDKRRQNSRSLSHDSHQQQLLKVGLWRDGQLILLKKFNNNSTYNHLLWLNNHQANSGESDGQDDDTNNQMEIGFAISKSLQRLASIRSKCSPPKTGKTCKLCHKQIEQTLSQIRQEEIRLLQSQSASEPKAISSILSDLSSKANKQQSIFDTVSNSNFDEDNNDNDNKDQDEEEQQQQQQQQQMDDKSSNNKRINSNSNDDIKISASSLFDLNTQKQVEQQRRIDIQRSYNHLMHSNREQAANRWNNMRSIQPSMNLSGILMSLLSVMGIVCVVSSMAYFYPNMLERKDKADSSSLKATTQTGGSFYTNSQQEGKLGGVDSLSSSSSSSSSSSNSISANSSLTQSSIDNINDYFLLTGLLMLYSINIAFLLPATLNVCWFRRIGLASSYTMVFSSILVKILSNYRQCWRQKLNVEKLQLSSSLNSQQQLVLTRTHYQQVMDPVEENVEVTFESLPPEQTTSSNVGMVQSGGDSCSTVDQLSNAYQTTTNQQSSSSDNQQQQQPKYLDTFRNQLPWITCKNSTLLTLLIGLILSQSVISIIWLVKQPPEPTLLYSSCWRCASPSKSPILFLYEPLIGLLYPAFILLFGWLWAVLSFKLALNNEEKYRLTTRRLLLNNPLISNNQRLNINYQNLLDHKLRDAKSLVITTTLLVLTWSLSTLNMISSSQKLLSSLSSSGSFFSSTTINSDVSSLSTTTTTRHQTINQTELFSKTEDFTLVYSNIISGVVIFTFLFIYRIHLFRSFKCSKSKKNCCCCFITPYRKSVRSRCLIIRSSSGAQQFLTSDQANQRQFQSQAGQSVLKYNESTSGVALQANGNKWLDYANDTYPVSSFGDSLFTGSQFSASSSRRERLRLQQFNTYGTYSSSSTSNNNSNSGINNNNNSDINPLALQALASSFVASSKRAKPSKVRQQTSGLFDTNSSFGKSSNKNNNKNKSPKKGNKSPSLFFGHSASSSIKQKSPKTTGNENNKLQRRQSANSVASSTAKLVTKDNNSMIYNNDMFDTLSCASSVASSSTSQLHGNDLYPIDCSIQPEV